jgi:hypothetical protein
MIKEGWAKLNLFVANIRELAMDGASLKPYLARLALSLCLAGLLLPGGSACAATGDKPGGQAIAQAGAAQPSESEKKFVPADGKPIAQPAEPSAAAQPPGDTQEGAAAAPAMTPPDTPAETATAPEQPPGQAMEPPAPPPPPAETAQAPGEWERGALENLYEPDPNAVRVAILNASGKPRRAGMIAFFLEEYRRGELEDKIGKKISVVNLSNLPGIRLRDSVIYYRPGHMRAALLMADVIPGKQVVAPMSEADDGKIGIDVEIRVGRQTP